LHKWRTIARTQSPPHLTEEEPLVTPRASFDSAAFYGALDAARRARNLTWKDLAAQASVSASTLTRIGQGKRPDVDSLAALCHWAGLEADQFMQAEGRTRKSNEEPLAMISTYLRTDPNLSPTSADLLDEMIKTTYQRLRED
jgi:transcriptional regulator with XRE-family HTH domain